MAMGEAGGATKEEALKYCSFDSNEFDMLIHFGHCWADCDDANHLTPGKWSKGSIDLNHIKNSFNRWFRMLNGDGWNLIYWHNHDHPRVVSHYGNDNVYHNESGKMLAYSLYMMPGTPIIYQGEEIGMTNVDYDQLNDFRDVEVYTEYDNFISFGATHEVAMQALRDRSRDNARSPFQWDKTAYSGFSKVSPWMNVNRNYSQINLKDQIEDENSIYNTYKELIKIRKEYKVNDGILHFIDIKNKDSFIYINETETAKFLVLANFRSNKLIIDLDLDIKGYENILYNYEERCLKNKLKLLPYEALVYKLKK
jgi:glycosidase